MIVSTGGVAVGAGIGTTADLFAESPCLIDVCCFASAFVACCCGREFEQTEGEYEEGGHGMIDVDKEGWMGTAMETKNKIVWNRTWFITALSTPARSRMGPPIFFRNDCPN